MLLSSKMILLDMVVKYYVLLLRLLIQQIVCLVTQPLPKRLLHHLASRPS